MYFYEVVDKVFELCQDDSKSFPEKGIEFERELDNCTLEDLLQHLDNAGVISERFAHDSTEEKVFAKYCDALLASSLKRMGLQAAVIEARGDAADVVGSGADYQLVGDAKAFRLSRTAKNQKDFKVEPLNQWRNGADFACLLSPLYQYPNTKSQIYQQAIRYNVTLISYTHLAFMIRHNVQAASFKQLLQASGGLTPSKSAKDYWYAIDSVMLQISNASQDEWRQAIEDSGTKLQKQVQEQLDFWQSEKEKIQSLDRDAAIRALIEARKIDSKIEVIQKFLQEIEE